MGWENRNGRQYFYETTYVDGERIRRCHGYSLDAFIAAQRVENERKERERDIANIRALQTRDQQIDRKVAEFAAFTNNALRQQLIPHGFHWTNGRWRKQRFHRKNYHE